MQRISLCILPIIGLIAAILAGCGRVEHKAENKIAEALQEKIGPAKSYNVNICGSPLKLIKGKMERLDIVGQNVELKNGFKLALLKVSVYGLVFDTDTKEIKRADKTVYSATISQSELARYLTKMYPDIPDLKVELRNGQIDVSARPTVAGVGATVKAEAGLQAKDGHKLILDLKKVSAAGIPAPGFAREYIETKVNPVLDSRDLGFNATVCSVKLARGSITISGNLDLVPM